MFDKYDWDLIPQMDCDRLPDALRLALIDVRDRAEKMRTKDIEIRMLPTREADEQSWIEWHKVKTKAKTLP